MVSYTASQVITIPSPNASQPQYLSIVLDTNTKTDRDELYPSWGTFVVNNALPVLPAVSVRPTKGKTQAAEGAIDTDGSGEFTFYRDGGDASSPLTVNFSVASGAGNATPTSDYVSIGTSVVIPAGAYSVTVPVTAHLDDASEGTEAVTVTLSGDPTRYRLGTNTTATVNILDHKKYFVYFYGFAGPGKHGDHWLDKLDAVQESRGYTPLGDLGDGGFAENRGSRALRTFFAAVNQDNGRTISAAEAQSADVVSAGWSLGGSQAVNFTYYLSRVGPWVADYKLMAAVPVKALVTWDPAVQLKVGAASFPVLKTLRTVQDNVQQFRNYYQRRTGRTFFQRLDNNGAIVERVPFPMSLGDRLVIGNSVPVNLPPERVGQTRVDVVAANDAEERDRISALTRPEDADPLYNSAPGEPRYRLYGSGVNHDTLTWYAWRRSIDDLA